MSVQATHEEASSPHEQGESLQCFLVASIHGLAGPVPLSGNVKSALVPTFGWQKGGVGVKSDQAGTISVQRYLDQAGEVPVGAAITANLTANEAAAVTWSDGLPFGSFQATVTNGSASAAANLSEITVLLQSQ